MGERGVRVANVGWSLSVAARSQTSRARSKAPKLSGWDGSGECMRPVCVRSGSRSVWLECVVIVRSDWVRVAEREGSGVGNT
jgi:hypothetical protein